MTNRLLFRNPSLRGSPDLVKGYRPILLCLEISDPAGMARLLADPVKSQLPVGI